MTDQTTDLLALVAGGDRAGLEAALRAGADPDTADRWGVTALAQVAAAGDLQAVRMLLASGGAADRGSDAGNTPLMAAAARGHVEVARALLDAGADPAGRNKWGFGPKDWASWPANRADVLALLESRGG